jgi:small-conductance mechanosensitive channel
MNPALAHLLTTTQSLLNYPIIELGDSHLTFNKIAKFLVLIALILLAERHIRKVFRQRVLSRTHLSPELQYAVSRFAGYCFIAIGFFFACKAIKLDLSALAVVVGALGIGVGFGLQNIISNFISGLIILAERPIAIGHRIEIDGHVGQVTKIDLRSTTIVTNDNITIIVPNSTFITTSITNWSYGDPKVLMRVPIGVAYGSDLEKLKNILLEIANEHPNVLKNPAPNVLFLGFGDSSLNFELIVWTIEMVKTPKFLISDLNFAIERKLRENNIEIPFPQRDLHLRSGKLTLESKGSKTEITAE